MAPTCKQFSFAQAQRKASAAGPELSSRNRGTAPAGRGRQAGRASGTLGIMEIANALWILYLFGGFRLNNQPRRRLGLRRFWRLEEAAGPARPTRTCASGPGSGTFFFD